MFPVGHRVPQTRSSPPIQGLAACVSHEPRVQPRTYWLPPVPQRLHRAYPLRELWRCRLSPAHPSSRIHLPAPLCSAPITAFLRYYGCSDSCAPLQQRTGLPASRHATFADHSVPNHPKLFAAAFTRLISATNRPIARSPGFAIRSQARRVLLAETGSSSYRLVLRLLLLPTPPHDDAVTIGFPGAGVAWGVDSHHSGHVRLRAHERG